MIQHEICKFKVRPTKIGHVYDDSWSEWLLENSRSSLKRNILGRTNPTFSSEWTVFGLILIEMNGFLGLIKEHETIVISPIKLRRAIRPKVEGRCGQP